jgi:YD repeat-containing protein
MLDSCFVSHGSRNLLAVFKRLLAFLISAAYLSMSTEIAEARDAFQPPVTGFRLASERTPLSLISLSDNFSAMIGMPRTAPLSVPTAQPRVAREKSLALAKTSRSLFFVAPTDRLSVLDWRRAQRDPRAYAVTPRRVLGSRTTQNTQTSEKTPTFHRLTAGAVNKSVSTTAGETPWWQFEPVPLPGVGSAAVNVSNGNLIVRSSDMQLAHKGVPFSFVRTFNSQSHHDSVGTDGSQPSVFGNGWTNNYDAHIANNDAGGISVFGPDGARYDYAPTTSASYPTGWMPPAGIFDQLSLNSDGTYDVTDTKGRILRFYPPSGSACPTAAVCGRLKYVIGRNHYNNLAFTYSFSQSSYALSSMSQISVAAEDGETVKLTLASTSNGPLLSQLTWPSGQIVSYGYDSSGNLNSVSEVANNNSWIPQSYGYSGSQLSYVTDPRFSNSPNNGPCGDGNYEQFNYDGSNRVTSVQANGTVNTEPSDGTSTLLQPSATSGCVQFLEEQLAYSGSTTTFSDTNGHASTYQLDSLGRAVVTTPLGGAGTPTTKITWNAANEVTNVTDFNGRQTAFAYDANGNQTAIGFPSVSTNSGTINPTLTIGFDQNSNIVAKCDAVWNSAHSSNWSGSGTPASCTAQNGVPRQVWTTQSYEPYGEMTGTYTARGYHRTVAYSSSAQGSGDFGLPTSITGDSITEADSSVLSPSESFTYDSHGNRLSYNFGLGSWYFTYDSSNRMVTARDPDGFLAYASWYSNGQQQNHESSYQYALEQKTAGSGAVSFTYDPDGNTTSEQHHYGSRAGTTNYWYDSANRLVETVLPYDSSSDQTSGRSFMSRFLYDNSQDGTQNFYLNSESASISAHGNYFATEFFDTASSSWQVATAFASDADDRPTKRLFSVPGQSSLSTETWTYGTSSPNLDELTSSTDPLGVTGTFAYSALDELTNVSYSGGVTPSTSITYDPDGRTASVTKGDIGTDTLTYDADGNIATEVEPSTGLSSPATYTYGTDLDGARNSLSVSSSALSVKNLFQYVHRVDGLQTKQLVNFAAAGRSLQTMNWAYSGAGRLSKITDDEQSTTLKYDANGVLSSDAMPGTTLSYSFDPEGLLKSSASTNSNNSVAYTLNNRGEVTETQVGSAPVVDIEQFNDGMMFPSQSNTFNTPTVGPTYASLDSVRTSQTFKNSTEYASLATIQSTWSYDAAGRVTLQAENISNDTSLASSNSISYQYDANDHMTQISCTRNASVCPYGTVSYQYDLDGHVRSITGDQSRSFAPYNAGKETLHWADGQLLFTTNNQAKLDDLKVGTAADITLLTQSGAASTRITYWDRDVSGNEVSWHGMGSVGTSASPGDPSKGYASLPASSAQGLIYVSQERTDGYSDGANVFQGVRVSNGRLGAWMSRDANLGKFTKPISLKPYVLDANNSDSFSDTTG